MTLTTTITHQHKRLPARATEVTTDHGVFTTPAFMPVGTRAFVNCMTPDDLKQTGSEIILGGNTYLETKNSLGYTKTLGPHLQRAPFEITRV